MTLEQLMYGAATLSGVAAYVWWTGLVGRVCRAFENYGNHKRQRNM